MRQMAGIDVKHIPYSNTPGVVAALLSATSTTGSNWRTPCGARCGRPVEVARGRLAGALADHSQYADGR